MRVLPDPEFRLAEVPKPAEVPKRCMWCDKPSVAEALWAQAY